MTSVLYRLEPEGFTSGAPEALTSYLTRLAEAHVVPLRVLLHEILVPRLPDLKIPRSYTRLFQESARSMNGLGLYAERFSGLLEELTHRSELSKLTMLPWKDLFDERGKGLLKGKKSWCSRCFSEQREAGIPIHEPLRWHLSVMELCPTHGTPFETRCPGCGKEQLALAPFSVVGRCAWCGEDFSKGCSLEIRPAESPWQRWVSEKTASLFSCAIAGGRFCSIERFRVRVALTIQDRTDGNAEAMDRLLGWGTGTVGQWRRGRYRPRFDYFLHFCYRLGLDPVGFTSGDGKFGHPEPERSSDSGIQPPPPRVARSRQHDHARILKELESFVASGDDGLSLEKAAENLGVGTGYLRYRFPEQSSKISARYKEGIRLRAEGRFSRKAQAISATISGYMERGKYPSKAEVFGNAPGVALSDGRNPKLAEIWRSALIESSSSKEGIPRSMPDEAHFKEKYDRNIILDR